jgi:hypothetical protein
MVLARDAPFPPRTTDQRVAVKEKRGFDICERFQLMSLLVIDGDRVVALGGIPSDEATLSSRYFRRAK